MEHDLDEREPTDAVEGVPHDVAVRAASVAASGPAAVRRDAGARRRAHPEPGA